MAEDGIIILEAGESADEAKRLAELMNGKKYTVTLGSRAVLDAFFAMNGMDGKSGQICAAIAPLAAEGETAVKQRLIDDVRMLPCKAETLLDFISAKGGAADTVFALEQYCGISPEFDKALDDFKALVLMLLVYGVPAERISVDLAYSGGDEFRGTVFRLGDTAGGFR